VRTAIVIPARYASTRLPGKPLLRSTGKYLIQHVYERACLASRAQEVVVATDDPRIVAAVESFGGRAMMTSRDHPSGTDRIAEVARSLDADLYINLQGDEPLIDPTALDRLVELMERDSGAGMATLAVPLTDEESFRDPNCVKVVCDDRGRAMYFSRCPIPHVRGAKPDFRIQPPRFMQHLGAYAYRKSVLFQLSQLPPTPLESLEKLEQLRALAHGIVIQVGVIAHSGRGVDTLDDYERFVRKFSELKKTWRIAA
jgi:3-deoxy-manno-octulosonate cytidylyltransferase (CMP-KDO synthetase)